MKGASRDSPVVSPEVIMAPFSHTKAVCPTGVNETDLLVTDL